MITFWLGLARVVIGGVCIIIGLNLLTRRRMFVGNTFSATGTVIGIDSINGETRSVVARFTTPAGETRDVRVAITGDFRVGQEVTLFYDPANPQDVKIPTFFEQRLLPVVFIAIGVFLLISLWWI